MQTESTCDLARSGEAALRIPFVVRLPGARGGGVHVSRPVSQVDAMPTLLAMLGIDGPANLDGITLTSPPDPDRPIYAETVYGLVAYGFAPLAAVYQGDLKYVHGPSPELYDRSTDPLEHHNLYAEVPEQAEALLAALHRELGPDLDAALSPQLNRSVSAEGTERLRALGYVVDRTGEVSPLRDRPDPRLMVPILVEVNFMAAVEPGPETTLQRVLGWLSGTRLPRTPAERIERIEAITREHPDFEPAYHILATLHLANGDPASAERAIARALELWPDSPTAANLRADLLMELGRRAEARTLFLDLVRRHPVLASAHYGLGVLLIEDGNPSLAAEHLQRALELAPDNPDIRKKLEEALEASRG